MNAKGIAYTPSERYDILTILSESTTTVFATKKIAKDKPTPKYPGCIVFRADSEK